MELTTFFAAVGGDAERVLTRLPSEAMVRRFLHKFTDDPSFSALKAALEAEELPTAFRAAHTLKGTAATLGLDALSAAASALTEALRGADALPPAELTAAVEQAYETALAQIRRLDD